MKRFPIIVERVEIAIIIAVALGILIQMFIPALSALPMVIAALMCTQMNGKLSIKSGLTRALLVLIGGGIALVVVMVNSRVGNPYFFIVLCAAGTLMALIIGRKFNLPPIPRRIGAVILLLSVLVAPEPVATVRYTTGYFIATLCGAVIAFGISLIFSFHMGKERTEMAAASKGRVEMTDNRNIAGTSIEDFVKRHDYLICIDSDGCAMDTMDIKHIHCFGPQLVREWELEEWEQDILERWNQINLYTISRGINRFKGLVKSLKEINEKYCTISGIKELEKWAEESDELSEQSLENYAKIHTNCEILHKALAWSRAVNQDISILPEEEKHTFPGVKDVLALTHQCADIAIVSAANSSAVKEEWERCGLLEYIDVIMAQDCGSKSTCIASLLTKQYDTNCVMMVGDALGDREAAEKNGVSFYPILAKHEEKSWRDFPFVLSLFLRKEFDSDYQKQLDEKFYTNFQR